MLNDYELELLSDAGQNPKLSDSVKTYLDLRKSFSESTKTSHAAFRKSFSRYYKLLSAGLTPEWQDRYFELFFEFDQMTVVEPYGFLLQELYKLPRRQKDKALQFSFVSNLSHFTMRHGPCTTATWESSSGWGRPNWGR